MTQSLSPDRISKVPGWAPPVAAAFVAMLLIVLRLHLWPRTLSAPVSYHGDAIYFLVWVKALVEGPWNYYIPRLGAPFGMEALDFPIGCSLDLAIIKLLSLATRNPFLLTNLYWLLSVGLAAAFATLFFRYLGISRVWSATFAIIYAIVPWVVYRNISHLNLLHFMVPPAAYLGLSLARPTSNAESRSFFSPNRKLFIGIALCCALGLTYIYWAFFACIVITIGAMIGFVRSRSKPILLIAMIYIMVLGVASLANISASLVFWHRHGFNDEMKFKRVIEADIFALKIRQMLTPITEHPVPFVREIRRRIIDAKFPNDNNESAAAALGTAGSIGFLMLVAGAIVRARRGVLSDERVQLFTAFSVAIILIAQVGGFGSLFNLFVIHEFRAYNRLSPFISLFALGTLAITFDHFLNRKSLGIQSGVAAVTLAAATFDQIPRILPERDAALRFGEDRRFIQKLESSVPSGSMIFQLPNAEFPPHSIWERMDDYDNGRAYLHSRTLGWSWGAVTGRHHNWAKRTAALPVREFLERIAFARFGGVLLDRWGYPDRRIEEQLGGILGRTTGSEGDRWVFFDLRTFRAELVQSLSADEVRKKEELALDPTTVAIYSPGSVINFGNGGNSERFKDSGWSVTEERMTWTEGKRAVLNFSNLPQSHAFTLKIKAGGLTRDPALPAQPTEVYANGRKIADWTVRETKDYTASIPAGLISPEGTLIIELRIPRATSPDSLGMNGDTRRLGLSVFTVILEPQT